MFYQQISFLDGIEKFEMYDGFEVINTVNIQTDCGRQKLKKGEIAYFVTKYNGKCSVDFPNEYGGAYGFDVSEKQFKEHFRNLNKKVYPKRKEIWNGKAWIKNPSM